MTAMVRTHLPHLPTIGPYLAAAAQIEWRAKMLTEAAYPWHTVTQLQVTSNMNIKPTLEVVTIRSSNFAGQSCCLLRGELALSLLPIVLKCMRAEHV